MTIKFLHVRPIDKDLGDIQPFGGVTIAYSIVDSPSVAGICVNLAKCHPDDRFCFETGRKIAAQKLHEQGPLDVLPLEHPISDTIVDWLANSWWPSRRKYGGYSIDIIPDHKYRWLSTFSPSQEYITGDLH